jgi:hypothetical protein
MVLILLILWRLMRLVSLYFSNVSSSTLRDILRYMIRRELDILLLWLIWVW